MRKFKRWGVFAIVALGLIAPLAVVVFAQENDQSEGAAAPLSASEKEQLRQNADRFAKLEPAQQDQLRHLHSEISTSPDAVRLREVMVRYHEWLKSLTGEERAELMKLPETEKLDRIKQLMQRQQSQQFRSLVNTPLAPDDVRAIFQWIDDYIARHEEDFLATFSDDTRRRLAAIPDSRDRRRMILFSMTRRQGDAKLPMPVEKDWQDLQARLSTDASAALAKVDSAEHKLKLLQEWMRASVMSRFVPQVSKEQLISYYQENREKLDPQQRERLESLPPDMFVEEVRKIYFQSRSPWRHRPGGDWRRPEGDRPGDPRGRDDDNADGPRFGRGGPDGRREHGLPFGPPPPPNFSPGDAAPK